MAIIYTYPLKGDLALSDKMIISDGSDDDKTKSITVQQLVDLIPGFVPGAGTVTEVAASTSLSGLSFSGSPINTQGTLQLSGTLGISSGGTGQTTAQDAINALTDAANGSDGDVLVLDSNKNAGWSGAMVAGVTASGTYPSSTGAPLIISPTSGDVIIQSAEFDGGTNIGHVPSYNGNNPTGVFLKGDGNWDTPPSTSYSVFTVSSPGLVAANPSGTQNKYLKDDGSWDTPTGSPAPVDSVSTGTSGTSTGAALTINPTTGAVKVASNAFDGGANVGHVPTAASAAAGTYLDKDGNWTVPPGNASSVGNGELLYTTMFQATNTSQTNPPAFLIPEATSAGGNILNQVSFNPATAGSGGTGTDVYAFCKRPSNDANYVRVEFHFCVRHDDDDGTPDIVRLFAGLHNASGNIAPGSLAYGWMMNGYTDSDDDVEDIVNYRFAWDIRVSDLLNTEGAAASAGDNCYFYLKMNHLESIISDPPRIIFGRYFVANYTSNTAATMSAGIPCTGDVYEIFGTKYALNPTVGQEEDEGEEGDNSEEG